jgi:23S rRNA pseudouridine1911/1915/1917 synthase
MSRLVVPDGSGGERVDRVLAGLVRDVSRSTIQRWIEEGRVCVGGRPCRAKDRLRAGDVVEFEPGPRPASEATPDASVPFRVVWEDEHLLVVDKPAGVVVHPARGHASGTLVNGLLALPGFLRPAEDPDDPDGAFRPGIVHRIDKDTSGLLVVAKSEGAREGIKALLAAHDVERRYDALTCGVPRSGRIESLHGRDPRARLRFSSKVKDGKRAITHVEVREIFGAGLAALVSCRLETGRTHQIRVHLAEQTRTPLLGDALYGGMPRSGPLVDPARLLGRQALHAAVLGFRHPMTGEQLRFESPLPEDLLQLCQQLRAIAL